MRRDVITSPAMLGTTLLSVQPHTGPYTLDRGEERKGER